MAGDPTPGGGRQPSWMQPPDITPPPEASHTDWWPAGSAPLVQPMDEAARRRRAYADARNREVKRQQQLSRLLGFGGLACFVLSVVVFLIANQTAAPGPPGDPTASRPIGALMDLGTVLVAVGAFALATLLFLKIKWNSQVRMSPDYIASQRDALEKSGATVGRRRLGSVFGRPVISWGARLTAPTWTANSREEVIADAEAAQAGSAEGRPEEPAT